LRFLGEKGNHEPHRKVNNTVDLSTIVGFKGLETPIAVLLNLSEYNLPLDNPIMASLVYVACTRAKHMLYVMVQKDDPKRAMLEEALKNIRTTGSMVLEGSDANFEFVGTVSHYNPERVGWLEVSDPAVGKNSIMFFPHDARSAGIDNLKAGDSVRFRLHVEGQATIAADLKLMDREAVVDEAPEPPPAETETAGVQSEPDPGPAEAPVVPLEAQVARIEPPDRAAGRRKDSRSKRRSRGKKSARG